MDLLSTVRKSGSRGGVNFSWEDVASSSHRENYLGHSLKAPVGRWAKGRDLNWYAKSDPTAADSGETEEEKQERERKEEIRKIKEAEEDAIARALGLPITPRNTTGANDIQVVGSKVASRETADGAAPTEPQPPAPAKEQKESREARKRESRRDRHRDSEHRHRRRRRSGDRDRDRDRSRSRSRERRRDTSPHRKERDHKSRRRSRSPDRSLRRPERRRDDEQDRGKDYARPAHDRRSRSRSRIGGEAGAYLGITTEGRRGERRLGG
ncbi:kinase phosphorylation protein-domain-containing protein [Cercophora scortea]|uniref:Kinase phosphorylation protein-domain-containing protein n=1 Tax=Cercophora scortea TaxID=314031 RepID=A0AAE0MD13_9PEZI|nr:kinase phosphorylation protein-domain-containing protein [Cercophora scortea]